MATTRFSDQPARRSSPAILAGIVQGVAGRWKTLNQRRRLRALMDRDQCLLEDIGVTRDEIRWALSLPYDVNAAEALDRVARRRRARAR